MKTIRPQIPLRSFWMIVVLGAILYNVFAIPFRLAFSEFPTSPHFFYFDILADLIYLVDIGLGLHTAVLQQGAPFQGL